MSNEVKNNHGASIKYLPFLLTPVHISIMSDPIIMNSLNQLSIARGAYAHGKSEYTLSPEKAIEIVNDCLILCDNVRLQANSNIYE